MAILVLSLDKSMKLQFKIVKVGFRYYVVYIGTKNMSTTYAICMQACSSYIYALFLHCKEDLKICVI